MCSKSLAKLLLVLAGLMAHGAVPAREPRSRWC
jgi:hypothetical protein